jgi:hypothetical protein
MRDVCQTSPFELHARELGPLFRELIATGIDSPKKIATELNRRRIPRLNGNKWCGRSVMRALQYPAPELVDSVRHAGRRYKPANLKRAQEANQERAAAHWFRLLRSLTELIASGIRNPNAVAAELNRWGVGGVNGGTWCRASLMEALRRDAPEVAQELSGRDPAVVRASLELAWRATQKIANDFAARMLPIMRELIANGFTPYLIAAELNRRGIFGRYGKKWRDDTVRKSVQRADPALYEKWSEWCAGRVVRRDLRADLKHIRDTAERRKQKAAAYGQSLVRIVEPLISAGNDSATKLVLELVRLKVPTPAGGHWRPDTVLRILKRVAPRLYRLIRPLNTHERSERFAAHLRPLIDELIAQGITQTSAIVAELDRRKVPTARGAPSWSYQSVQALLRRFGHLGPPKRRYRSLSARDLARQLGVKEDDVYAAARRGGLVGIGAGRAMSFPPDTIERTLYSRARAARRGHS